MTQAICRTAAALLFASVLLAASTTRADGLVTPLSLERHLDVPVARALDMFFDAADTQQLTMRGFAHIRHTINLASVRIWPTPRLGIRVGVGTASLVDSPVACPARTGGGAVAGSVYYAVIQPRGLSLGVELSTLQVHYGNGDGIQESTVMLALSTR